MTTEQRCPICKSWAKVDNLNTNTEFFQLNCNICGKFNASFNFNDDAPHTSLVSLRRLDIQGAIREKNYQSIPVSLINDNEQKENCCTVNQLLQSVSIPKNPKQRIDKFLLYLAKESEKDENLGRINIRYKLDYPLAYCNGRKFLDLLSDMITPLGYIETPLSSGETECRITLAGWDRVEELQKTNSILTQGFVACSFSKDHNTYLDAIVKGIEESGYDSMCIKDEHYSETILDKGLGEIRKSKFIVADLTHERPSVMIEVGFALGLGIDVIFVVKKEYEDKKEKLEFYSQNYNVSRYMDAEHLTEIVSSAISARLGKIYK